MKVLLISFIIVGLSLLIFLILLLRKLINEQVSFQVESWKDKAKIPKRMRGMIKLKVKWRNFS